MEAYKKAGLIIDYKVFRLTPKSPDQPNIILWITFKNGMAALDKNVELESSGQTSNRYHRGSEQGQSAPK